MTQPELDAGAAIKDHSSLLAELEREAQEGGVIANKLREEIARFRTSSKAPLWIQGIGVAALGLVTFLLFLLSSPFNPGKDREVQPLAKAQLTDINRLRQMAFNGGVLPSIRFMSSSAISQNPSGFRSIVCLKAFLVEMAMLVDRDKAISSGVQVLSYEVDSWFNGPESTEQRTLSVRRSKKDRKAPPVLVMEADCGVKECDHSQFKIRVEVNGKEIPSRWHLQPTSLGSDDTLHWLVVNLEETEFVGTNEQATVRVILKSRNGDAIPFSLAALDIGRFKEPPERFSWRVHFAQRPLAFSFIPYEESRRVLKCDPSHALPGPHPFVLGQMTTKLSADLPLDTQFASDHPVYSASFSSSSTPVAAVGFSQAAWTQVEAAEERDKTLKASNEMLLGFLDEQRHRPIEVFGACEKCQGHEAIAATLHKLSANGKAKVRYLIGTNAVKTAPQQLLDLPVENDGETGCKVAAQGSDPNRLFGIWDPDFPHRSFVAWTVVPEPSLGVAFSGEAPAAAQKKAFDEAWRLSKERCSPRR